MVLFVPFLWSLLVVFVARTRSTVIEEHDGELALESEVHFHNGFIPEGNLSGLLPVIYNRTAGGEDPLAHPEVSGLYQQTMTMTVYRTGDNSRLAGFSILQFLFPFSPTALNVLRLND